ncbi:MAG: hypothetical protein WKG03_18390 [Telluria sp.]
MAQPTLTGTTLHRSFETAADRRANQSVAPSHAPLQRSHSYRSLYSDGSVVREHVHDNARSGGNQFQHVIGGFNPDGSRWGRNDPQNG